MTGMKALFYYAAMTGIKAPLLLRSNDGEDAPSLSISPFRLYNSSLDILRQICAEMPDSFVLNKNKNYGGSHISRSLAVALRLLSV